MERVRFPLVLLSEPRDASRPESGDSPSVDRDRSRGTSASIAQVPRASRRCLPASETLPPASPGLLAIGPSARSCRVPRESLGARDDLPEQRPCQVAFRKLQGEVPSVADEAPVLKSRCRRLVGDQFWMTSGRASRGSRSPRL